MFRKLLFFQEDAHNFNELRDALTLQEEQWRMRFVFDAKEAAIELESRDWEIVIADLGSALGREVLTQAKKDFPEVVRIGLVHIVRPRPSDLSLVHQYLSTPFEVKEMEVAVERACQLRELLEGESICRTVGELGELPAAPSVYLKLVERLDYPDVSVDEIADIICNDVGLSAKLLQLVNSAIFRTSREIVTVKVAASYLGLDVIKNLVLSTEIYRGFEKIPKKAGLALEELQEHSRLTAKIAKTLPLSKLGRDAAIVAALLHDVGKLVVAWKLPDRYAKISLIAKKEKRPMYLVEQEMWGITHAEIGAYLLGLWGLPNPITEAVAFHHFPNRVPHLGFDPISAVYIAEKLAHFAARGKPSDEIDWDMDYMESIGVADQIPLWVSMVQPIAAMQNDVKA